ncbi:hypothetical protein B9Z19DRAFT_1117180 [Tuber borchii]|uniref:RRM domain-containing protein n=1 Tax=Tuber borchii TaxID=42251 RepID=A0A2T6ZEF6_TUBBO|nr:hypothetical protein B9Z19DRAFT_1117180 [Tuber borchii]
MLRALYPGQRNGYAQIGKLEPWIDKAFGEGFDEKMIRDKFLGKRFLILAVQSNSSHCFVRFGSPARAARELTLRATLIPGSSRPLKLNYASGGGLAGRRGMSRGYGVVSSQMRDQQSALTKLSPTCSYGAPQPMNQFTDPKCTTVFVSRHSGYVTQGEFRSLFPGFRRIFMLRFLRGKADSRVRLHWGRSQRNSDPTGTPYRPTPPPPVYQ